MSHFMAVYYRIYAEDGVIPSKTSATPSDYFLGRIKVTSVPPPHNANSLKRALAKVENVNITHTYLFITPYDPSPMEDSLKVTIFSNTGPGSLPQEPLALVAKLSELERSAVESDIGLRLRSQSNNISLTNTSELNTASSNTRYCMSILDLLYISFNNDWTLFPKFTTCSILMVTR
jgi:hypothetical protein